MILTEEDAKNKICPRTIGQQRIGYDMFTNSCLGSKCMAWMWKEGYEQNPLTGESMLNNKGYCGLAGKVE